MGHRRSRRNREHTPFNAQRVFAGMRRIELKRGREYLVQTVSAVRAQKTYTCPGCHREIPEAQAHVVVIRADEIMGDDQAVAARRHWHTRCWQIA